MFVGIMTRVCWRPVIQRYEELNLCKSNCETKKKLNHRLSFESRGRGANDRQRSARATESVSCAQKCFSHNDEGLIEFQRETSTFCVTFQGSIDLSFGDLRLVCRPWSFKPVALVSGKRFQPFDSFSNEMLCS